MKDVSRAGRHLLPALPEPVGFHPATTALIVVDMQNAYASEGGYLDLAGFDLSGIDKVIDNVAAMMDLCRKASVQIICLQNGWDPAYVEAGGPYSANVAKSNALRVMREKPELQGQLLSKGGWDYALVDAVMPKAGDIIVPKPRYSGFVNTALDSILRTRGIRTLLVCGVASNVCVETTIRDAFGLEYHAVMMSDCCLQAGPAFLQDATIYNVQKFFGWTATLDALAETLAPLPAADR